MPTKKTPTVETAPAKPETAKTEETAKPETTKPEETAKPAEKPNLATAFSWDALPEASAQEYTRGGSVAPRIDIEAETPAPIKARIRESFDIFSRIAGESTDKKLLAKAAQESTRVQPCGTKEQAEAFLTLARRYAKFSGMTLRGAVHPTDATKVVFRAKPAETRVRKTKSGK